MSPLYSYTCDDPKCEKSRKIMDFVVPLRQYDAKVKCPKCGKPLTKVLSAPMFRIK